MKKNDYHLFDSSVLIDSALLFRRSSLKNCQ
jgi:hypothetical protein